MLYLHTGEHSTRTLKLFPFGESIGADVEDPFGGMPEDYRRCLKQIEALVKTRLGDPDPAE